MKIAPPEYLGDGVYASVPDPAWPRLTLTTGHHEAKHADNVIIFEPDVLAALLKYIERLK